MGLADVNRYGVPYFGRSDLENKTFIAWMLYWLDGPSMLYVLVLPWFNFCLAKFVILRADWKNATQISTQLSASQLSGDLSG